MPASEACFFHGPTDLQVAIYRVTAPHDPATRIVPSSQDGVDISQRIFEEGPFAPIEPITEAIHAKLDLLGNGNSTDLSTHTRLLQEYGPLAPKDREHEWNMHIEALLTITQGSAELPRPPMEKRYFRVSRKSHTTAKAALRRAVQTAATE